jgi:hypothetical protein
MMILNDRLPLQEGAEGGLLLLCSDPVAAWHLAQAASEGLDPPAPGEALAPLLACRAQLHDVASHAAVWDGDPRCVP